MLAHGLWERQDAGDRDRHGRLTRPIGGLRRIAILSLALHNRYNERASARATAEPALFPSSPGNPKPASI